LARIVLSAFLKVRPDLSGLFSPSLFSGAMSLLTVDDPRGVCQEQTQTLPITSR
jgi:hypothetical protein